LAGGSPIAPQRKTAGGKREEGGEGELAHGGFSLDRSGLGELFAFLAFMQASDRLGPQKTRQ
jgi:hypothetical protein